ncbi:MULTISPECIES: transposase [unclassified Acinetobacter]|uniref:transposase n=1 Tax=unclassified Acinetobacter TaxID=196816 RepID=UPI00293484E2|nr:MULTISPECIES: transposase [unclassified Acinetobacter]WOE33070.1 transposase [Acinetobacter sp. SAAs470]WOE37872.1 transposase [Acinetobacter sp. SAAs474]
MHISNGWMIAKAVNGEQIRVKIVPLKRKQNSLSGPTWVEVCKQIQVESGEKFNFNLDGKSFYKGLNNLYKLVL